MSRRAHSTDPYEITVKTGRTELEYPNGSKGVAWDSIKTYDRFGRWDADMKADEERRKNPDAVVTVRLASALRVLGNTKPDEPWRDRAPKEVPTARCCWVCGRLGGQGFTNALRNAGYRMAPGTVAHAHNRCMDRANRQHKAHLAKDAAS